MNKITIDRATVEQALEALNAALSDDRPYIEKSKQAITALRQALEQPAQQQSTEHVGPVAWLITFEKQDGSHETCAATGRFKDVQALCDFGDPVPLYTHPPVIDKSAAIRIATALGWEPKREWVGLTDEEILQDWDWATDPENFVLDFAKAIESKLRARNT